MKWNCTFSSLNKKKEKADLLLNPSVWFLSLTSSLGWIRTGGASRGSVGEKRSCCCWWWWSSVGVSAACLCICRSPCRCGGGCRCGLCCKQILGAYTWLQPLLLFPSPCHFPWLWPLRFTSSWFPQGPQRPAGLGVTAHLRTGCQTVFCALGGL